MIQILNSDIKMCINCKAEDKHNYYKIDFTNKNKHGQTGTCFYLYNDCIQELKNQLNNMNLIKQ